MRQKYSKKQLDEIIKQYKDLGPIKKPQQVNSGFENTNYIVQSKQGPLVIKIYEGDFSAGNVDLETRLMKKAYRGGVKCPYLYRNTKGKLYNNLKGKLSIVMEYIDGADMYQRPLTNHLVYRMGQQAGMMDALFVTEKRSKYLRRQSAFNMNFFRKIKHRISVLPGHFDKQLFIDLFNQFGLIKPIFNALPKGLIHNDIGPQNILVRKGELVGIIDFSNFAYSPYIQNIAVALTNTCFNYHWDPQQALHFLRGYREYRLVSREEIELLPYLISARYATVIVEFNYHNRKFGVDPRLAQVVEDQYVYLRRFRELGHDIFKLMSKRQTKRR
jgi:ethanolamine-phosphate phospho-lyase